MMRTKALNQISFIALVLLIIGVVAPSVQAAHPVEAPGSGKEKQVAEIGVYQGKDFSLSVGLSTSVVNGEAREVVYETFGLRRGDKISELVWDIDNAWMAGGFISAQIKERFLLNLSALVLVSGGDANMVDKDWLSDLNPTVWTDRSDSPTNLEKGLILDLNASYAFLKWEHVGLRAILGYKYDNWKWEDHNGSYIYSSDPDGGGFRDLSGDFPDTVGIRYEQKFHFPYVGLGADFYIFESLSLNALFRYSPLVEAEDKDHHVYRDIHYKETFSGGDCYIVGINARWEFYDSIFLMAAFDYQEIREIKGDTEIEGFPYKFKDAAGIANKTYISTLSLGYEF